MYSNKFNQRPRNEIKKNISFISFDDIFTLDNPAFAEHISYIFQETLS